MFVYNQNSTTLWAFGDSYTESMSVSKGTMRDYVNYKGYVPKNYVEIISEKKNLNLKNFARGGVSNREILSQFLRNINQIRDNDILIFGWTNPGRFRAVHNDEFYEVVSNTHLHLPNNFTLSQNTLDEIIIMRESFIYLSEISEYIIWIIKTFPKCKVVNWTWVHYNQPSYPNQIQHLNNFINQLVHQGSIENIVTETKGLINDHHYSEKAHQILADKLINFISN